MQVRDKNDGKIMAMKVTKNGTAVPVVPSHPFIIDISNIFSTLDKTYMIQEYIAGGTTNKKYNSIE